MDKGEKYVILLSEYIIITDKNRFIVSDYALCQALKDFIAWLRTLISYDICCQYIINLLKRFRENFKDHPNVIALVEECEALIPQLHIKGHKGTCKSTMAFDTTPSTGRTDGEFVEPPWFFLKAVGRFTREMNAGNRRDTLDDFINFFNWMKMQTMGTSSSSYCPL